ncbi:histidine-rich glycoprotein-like [Temnothorax curvispinosus]|uniref:Histidine-rich glycoprotein-like n=1 Tax=Temnothorax curvispinosus TaxID=300111 RepID=A0A6J1PHA7_9HYME|nr:histidine-rich glycoprotein-like [Temnothorax curvispinosus]
MTKLGIHALFLLVVTMCALVSAIPYPDGHHHKHTHFIIHVPHHIHKHHHTHVKKIYIPVKVKSHDDHHHDEHHHEEDGW